MAWIRYRIGPHLAEASIDTEKIVQVVECVKRTDPIEIGQYGSFRKPYPGTPDDVAAMIECVGGRSVILQEYQWAQVRPQLRSIMKWEGSL